MKDLKKVLYVTGAFYPYGWAYAARVQGFVKLLTSIGYEVTVICDYISDEKYMLDSKNGEFLNSKIRVTCRNRNTINKIRIAFLSYYETCEYLNENQIDLIIMSSRSDRFVLYFKEFKKRNIPVILESCEWFHPSNWRFGKLDPRYWQFQNCWNSHFIKADGVIAISRLLEKHYSNHISEVIRIPTIMDVKNTPFSSGSQKDIVQLAFVGGLGNGKDSLTNVFCALHMLKDKKEKFFLNIYGPDVNQLRQQLGNKRYLLTELVDCYKIHGFIPQEEISEIYTKCDYGIFIRPERRSSHAGFPTKLAEFMAAGTPVITNDTGDIGVYLKDEINGYLIQNSSVESVVQIFLRILNMSEEDKIEMQKKARLTAEKAFDYRNYNNIMKNFLNKVYNGLEH